MRLPPGTRLGPYEILAPLGAGGMGEVYKANDPRLGRDIAIKVLPEDIAADPERLRRFEQEARAASALNHPNIVTIYDVGLADRISYIAMELVDGESLRQRLAPGPLAPRTVIDIGAQIASGLAKAHAVGLVHRDLKPENVMVTSDGLAKILDFGLAKLSVVPEAGDLASQAPTMTRGTEPGVVLGTVGYMSPEQAKGETVDFRSDQFSLGVILYEMAAGTRPFHRATAVETLTAILQEEPPPLDLVNPQVPEALRTIVHRCLAKDPERRYHSTRDLARDLTELRDRPASTAAGPTSPRADRRGRPFALAAGALVLLGAAGAILWMTRQRVSSVAASNRSIAILPFENFGGRAEEDYFSDGMTESLITDLAKIKGLLVIARNSVFAYKNKNMDVRKVGEDLHVRYVLEGSVQRAGDSVRVNAQLIDTASGYHVWAEKYDRPMKDLFAVQDELSTRIARSLQAAIGGSHTGVSPSPTSNLEAYDLFLRGRYFMNQFDWARKDDAMPLLEKAIALDPGFAQAHAALAAAYAKKAFEGDPDGSWRSKASAEIEKALALDPNLPQAYLARGHLAWTRDNGFPHEQAAADFHKAIELGSDAAHAGLANVYYHVGLLDKALAQYALALRTDPHDLDSLYRIPRIHLYQGKYAEALAEFDANLQFRGDFYVPIVLAHLGRWEEALRRAPALRHPAYPTDLDRSDQASTMAVLVAHAGDLAAAEREVAIALEKQGRSHFHHASYNIATAFALLKRNKEAIAWLVETAESGMPCYPLFERDPFLDNLRGDADFQAFLARQRAQFERFEKTL
jgi:serine/threonine protein kinase/tetratricopeptide (TPR) repeat protein